MRDRICGRVSLPSSPRPGPKDRVMRALVLTCFADMVAAEERRMEKVKKEREVSKAREAKPAEATTAAN